MEGGQRARASLSAAGWSATFQLPAEQLPGAEAVGVVQRVPDRGPSRATASHGLRASAEQPGTDHSAAEPRAEAGGGTGQRHAAKLPVEGYQQPAVQPDQYPTASDLHPDKVRRLEGGGQNRRKKGRRWETMQGE